jgi:hypothetical protein
MRHKTNEKCALFYHIALDSAIIKFSVLYIIFSKPSHEFKWLIFNDLIFCVSCFLKNHPITRHCKNRDLSAKISNIQTVSHALASLAFLERREVLPPIASASPSVLTAISFVQFMKQRPLI